LASVSQKQQLRSGEPVCHMKAFDLILMSSNKGA
jgi:hypothetical protein